MKILRLSVRAIDGANGWIGRAVAWLTLVMVLITVYDVIMRYIFHAGSVAIVEAEIHLFAMNFLLAAGWTFLKDGHVRVDLVYTRLNRKKKAWIDLLGSLLFCIPYCMLIIWSVWPFLVDSWSVRECSPDPGGLPCRYVLKACIPLAFLLIAAQAISQAIKNLFILTGKEEKL